MKLSPPPFPFPYTGRKFIAAYPSALVSPGPLPVVGAKRDSLSDAVEDNIWQIDPTVGAIRQLQSTIVSIRKALWWLLGLVVFIAVILFLRG